MDAIAADLVLLADRIVTLNPRRSFATALGVTGQRISAIGSRADARRWRDRRTRVIDVGGATVIPGLVDAHAHMTVKVSSSSTRRSQSVGASATSSASSAEWRTVGRAATGS